MDDRLTALLDDLHGSGVEHDAARSDRLERLRNIEPDSARLLALLVRAARARSVLELGTSNGYSTIWLADAASSVGGRVTSVEIDPARSAQAAENLARAGMDAHADLVVGDIADVLAGSSDGAWDFVLLDAERPAYIDYWPDLVRTLAPGGLLAVDNVVSHADQVAAFRMVVERDPRVVTALAPTGAGVLLIVKGGSGE